MATISCPLARRHTSRSRLLCPEGSTVIASQRLTITDLDALRRAGSALADGALVAMAFANFYALLARPDAATVRWVNQVKGRPLDQVGSVTSTPERLRDVFDWTALPPGVSRPQIDGLIAALHACGPFGFRGPAAPHVPDHLAQDDAGVRTTQAIAPGVACPSSAFLAQALSLVDSELLYITSANRSHHSTGAAEEPAHWRAEGIITDFAHIPGLVVLAHPDEAAARAAYPAFAPTSVSLLAFHAASIVEGRPHLTLERHGSLHVDQVRRMAARFGFGVTLGPRARRRLRAREY